jgi:hypothetical protein
MFPAFTRAIVKGKRGQRDMQGIPIDTAAFFTILPSEVLSEIGAYTEDFTARLELDHGECLEAKSIPSSSPLRGERT